MRVLWEFVFDPILCPDLMTMQANPPVKCKNLGLKTRSAELIFKVLKAVPSKSIEKQVEKVYAVSARVCGASLQCCLFVGGRLTTVLALSCLM